MAKGNRTMLSLLIEDVGLGVQILLWTYRASGEKAQGQVPWHPLNLLGGSRRTLVNSPWGQAKSSLPSKRENKSTNYGQMCYLQCWDRAEPHGEIPANTAICTSSRDGETAGHYGPGWCLNQGWEMKGSTLQPPEGMRFPFMKWLRTRAERISVHLNARKQSMHFALKNKAIAQKIFRPLLCNSA